MTRIFDVLVNDRYVGVDHPVIEGLVWLLAGAGIFVALAYIGLVGFVLDRIVAFIGNVATRGVQAN